MAVAPDVLKARSKMIAALDNKLKKDPVWQAFRAIDDMFVAALNGAVSGRPAAESAPKPQRQPRVRLNESGGSYGDLGVKAITSFALPVSTDMMVDYIGSQRKLDPDPKRARTNVQSALSHEARIRSIKWRGGRAWWLANREPPKDTE